MPDNQLITFIKQAKLDQQTQPEIHGIIRETSKDFKRQKNAEELRNNFSLMYGRRPFMMVIPLYDDNLRVKKPWVTTTLILFCIVMFFLTLNQDFFNQLGLIPAKFRFSGLLTSIFLHANFMHLIGNLFYFWTFGDNVEDVTGPVKYICFFFFCGIMAGLTHMFLNPESIIPAIGASGAISGLMGAYLYLFPKVHLKTWINGRIIDIPMWIYLGIWFLGQLFSTLLSLSANKQYSGVAFGAHVGGFIAGYLGMWLMKAKD